MIVVLKKGTNQAQIIYLISWLKEKGIRVHESHGEEYMVLGLVGDTSGLNADLLQAMDMVQSVKRIQDPYKKANRMFHPEDTVITLENGTKIGGENFAIMAGPCSVESEEQIIAVAKSVKESGAAILRGGAYKPRTSPYAFQGMGVEGIKLLLKAKAETGLPIVSEVMERHQLKHFDQVDILQVGARNMQNFELLKELGTVDKPILLKRGPSNTYQEWLMSAEYIMAGGNEQVILCERGIRTFETKTRNTMDIAAIPVLKEMTHLPVVADPSHATGYSRLVEPMALAAVAAGADGLIIEVHNDPQNALCDGAQSLRPEAFETLAKKAFILRKTMKVMG